MMTSRVPAAIDALIAILSAAPTLEGVRIVDGPSAVNFTERQRIYVGWQPSEEPAVSLTQEFAYVGGRRRNEDFTIACYAESRSGDKAMVLQRNRVFELVAAVEVALRSTEAAPDAPTLNNTVQWAHLTTGDLTYAAGDGALAGVAFTVTCRARI